MMTKVCPSCKECSEITQTSYPAERYVRMELVPVREDNKLRLYDFEADMQDEWSDYDDYAPSETYECSQCKHVYDASNYAECWEEMVWRKKDDRYT